MPSQSASKKYKALIVDVDGTLVPNKKDAVISDKVREAVSKASKVLYVGIATARPYFMVKDVFAKLCLSGPCIISSGAQIVDAVSGKVLKEHSIEKEDVIKISRILKELKVVFFIHDNGRDVEFSEKYIPIKPFNIVGTNLTEKDVEKILKKITNISTITAYKIPSWNKDRVYLDITNNFATKQHGILEVAKILGIDTHEIIGIGDGDNDFPLLMACGLKIAMGNAVPALKEIADYIAPSADEDGVADVINKFVLKKKP